MKIILPIIVILIIIVFLIIILNSNIYFSEDFANYNQETIEDQISIVYLPYNPFLKEKINEYEVIDNYREILNRSPTINEIKEKVYLTREELIEELYNSNEYEKMIKVQDNQAVSGIENSIARRNLIKKIIEVYKQRYAKEPVSRMLLPLRDCYIHLRNNIFLFIAFVHSNNYLKFENEVLSTTVLTKRNLLEIFDKYFNLLELKVLAEDKVRLTRGDPSLSIQTTPINDIDYEKLKTELNKLVDKDKINTNLEQDLIKDRNYSDLLNSLGQIAAVPTSISVDKPIIRDAYPSTEIPNLLSTATPVQENNLKELRNFFSSKLSGTDVYNNTTVGNIYPTLKL